MKLNELSPAPGSRKKEVRIGRGIGSGSGKTAGRGHKGQQSRSGGGVRPGFEGGQMPLHRRLPKRGFTNIFKKNIANIDLDALNIFEDGTVINYELLFEQGFVSYKNDGAKILANGEIEKRLVVQIPTSKQAAEKIAAAGGKVEVV